MQYRQDRGAVIPIRVHTIVISVQHDEKIGLDEMRDALKEKVVRAVVPAQYLDDDTVYHLQPSGRFVIGGPQVRDEGLLSPHAHPSIWANIDHFGKCSSVLEACVVSLRGPCCINNKHT